MHDASIEMIEQEQLKIDDDGTDDTPTFRDQSGNVTTEGSSNSPPVNRLPTSPDSSAAVPRS